MRDFCHAAAPVVLALLAAAPPALAGGVARLEIAAVVEDRAFIEADNLPQRVDVSAADIERGYVDLQDPVEVDLRSNHPAGVALEFRLNSPRLLAVEVSAASGAEIRSAGLYVPQRARGLQKSQVVVKLRLRLAPGIEPGSVAFPLALYLTPL